MVSGAGFRRLFPPQAQPPQPKVVPLPTIPAAKLTVFCKQRHFEITVKPFTGEDFASPWQEFYHWYLETTNPVYVFKLSKKQFTVRRDEIRSIETKLVWLSE